MLRIPYGKECFCEFLLVLMEGCAHQGKGMSKKISIVTPKAQKARKSKSTLVHEIQVVYIAPKSTDCSEINSAKDAHHVLLQFYSPEKINHHEIFSILLLSRANKCIGFAKISEGGITATVVDQRLIFQVALKTNAVGIILCHNHPSGNLRPSDADITLTRKIREGAKLLDIQVLDHVILTSEGYYSFADEGML